MNNNDDQLDKRFKDLFENPPFFEPSERAMADMKHRLDAQKAGSPRRGFPWLFFLLPFLVLPFVFGTIHFYSKYQVAQQQVDDFNKQLSFSQQTTTNSDQHHITYIYDTIYQTTYKNEVIYSPSNSWNASQNLASTNNRHYQATPFSQGFPNHWPDFNQALPDLLREAHYFSPTTVLQIAGQNPLYLQSRPAVWGMRHSETSQEPFLSLLNPLPVLPPTELSVQNRDDLGPAKVWMDYQSKEPGISPLAYMVPIGWNVGLNLMPALSLGIPGNAGIGFSYGLSAELRFIKNWRLGVGVNRLRFDYQLKGNSFSDYPPASRDRPQDPIKELYITLQYVDIPVYFLYQFRSEKKIKPFITLGTVARKAVQQEFKYELLSSTSEYTRSTFAPSSAFQIPGVQGGLGFEYALGRHLGARAQLLYKRDFSTPDGEYIQPNYLGLEMGLQYNF